MDEAIVSYIKNEYNLLIGDRTAEELKIDIGSALIGENEGQKEIRGRDQVSGLPKTISVKSSEVQKALREPIENIIEAVKMTLEKTPPELSSDVMDRGIILTGGGVLLQSLTELIKKETEIPVHLAEDPLDSVVQGTGIALEEIDSLKKVLISPKKLS